MNIFVFSPKQVECAKKLDDRRLNKMITETYQIISTVLRENYRIRTKSATSKYNGTAEEYYGNLTLYKSTHVNHPVVKWAGQTRGNYFWTVQLLRHLCTEWVRRGFKVHSVAEYASEAKLDYARLSLIGGDERTPFVNCARRKDMGIDYTNVEDVHEAYRQYIHHRWKLDKYPPKRGGVLITEHLDLMEALNGRL